MTTKGTGDPSLNSSFPPGLSEILDGCPRTFDRSGKKYSGGGRGSRATKTVLPFQVTVSLENAFARTNISPLIESSKETLSVDLDLDRVSAIEKLLKKPGDSSETLNILKQNLEALLNQWQDVDPVLLEDLHIEPRGYLRESLEAIHRWLEERPSGGNAVCNCVWATGLGKSYLALLLAALLPEDQQLLVVTSSQILVSQLARLFSVLGRSISHVSCAAVPPDVELSPFGQVVFMTNRGASLDADSAQIKATQGKVTHLTRLLRPHLLIVDEMDTTYTMDQWKQVTEWMNQGTVVIAMSATRDHLVKASNYSGVSLDRIFVGGVEYALVRLGRDFYGPTVVDIGLAHAIERKLLARPLYFQWVIPLPSSALSGSGIDEDFEQVSRFIFDQMQRPEYRGWLTEANGKWKKMMLTARSIDRSLFLVEAAQEAAIGFRLEPITSDVAPIVRETSIARLQKGEADGIVGPNALSRGLNIPDLKVLIRLNPRSSMHTVIQEIGRINRAIGNLQSGKVSPESSIVIIDVVTPDWNRYITVPEALRFCGLSESTLAELHADTAWFEDLRRSPNSLRPRIKGTWGDTLTEVYSWFVENYPQHSPYLGRGEFEKALFNFYIKDPSRIGSRLPLSESDKGFIHSCLTDIVHIWELEHDPEWLSAENVITSGRVQSVGPDMVSCLNEIVEEWMEEYHLEEYNLRHEFSIRLASTSKSRSYYHEMVWEELFERMPATFVN
jgi:superfamily II DNA or RNA helicase